jgi:hypothetical protein
LVASWAHEFSPQIQAGHESVIENNIFYAPSLSTPLGLGFAPLGSTKIEGFTPRYLGDRWNFRPVGWASGLGATITCESGRELSPGGSTGVGPDEWMAFDYPNFSGQCRGAGDTLMAAAAAEGWPAIISTNSGRYHQVSVLGFGAKCMAPADAGGDGRVVFDFTETKIRIQNNTSSTWTGNVWVLLDLRDYLMEAEPATASPGSIPLPIPGQGSDAIVETAFGLWARTDFFGTIRPTPGTVGAMEAAR